MKTAFILNGAPGDQITGGRLNAALVKRARTFLEARGLAVRTTTIAEGYDVDTEVENHQWADLIINQFPVHWMAMPWTMKKYMDEVYSAGCDGRLCVSDGRKPSAPKDNYGGGGVLHNTRYMLSLTFNAPVEAFNDPQQYLFEGKSIDELMAPMHLNARFFAMKPLATFAAHDVVKNPTIAADFERFDAHLARHISPLLQD